MVAALTLLGLALRLWKIEHGLPKIYYMDEARVIYFALNMGGGDLNPHHFLHPNLYYYLMFFCDMIFILWGRLIGEFKTLGDAWGLYRSDPTSYYIIARGINAVLGALTVPVTYLIGKAIWQDKRLGFIGAGFLAFSFLHLQWSQIAYMDSTLTFFITLAFLMACLAYFSGKTRYFLLAGLVGGLAASTKYQGLMTFMWGPLAAGMLARRDSGHFINAFVLKNLGGFALFFILGFTAGTPFWIFDFQSFQSHLLTVWSWFKYGGQGQLGFDGHWNWGYYLSGPLLYGLGLPLEIAAIGGLFLLLTRRESRFIFFLSFPLLYFGLAGISDIHKASYALPLVPFFSLSAASITVWLVGKLKKLGARRTDWLLIMISVAVLAPSLSSSFRYGYLRSFADTRTEVIEWVRENIRPNQKILTSFFSLIRNGRDGLAEQFDPTVYDVRVKNRSSLKTLEEYRRAGFEYLVLDEWHRNTILVEGARHAPYRLTVELYRNFMQELEKSGKLLVQFSPYQGPSLDFDAENTQLLSRRLWKLKRPGPEIWIYKIQ